MTDVGLELLPPEQVTSSHVTVAPPGFSCFGLVQAVASRAALRGLVLLFRQHSTRALFVLLLPSNINLGQVGPGHAHSHPGHAHSLTHKHRECRVLCTRCCQSNSSSSQRAAPSSWPRPPLPKSHVFTMTSAGTVEWGGGGWADLPDGGRVM